MSNHSNPSLDFELLVSQIVTIGVLRGLILVMAIQLYSVLSKEILVKYYNVHVVTISYWTGHCPAETSSSVGHYIGHCTSFIRDSFSCF